MINGVENYMKTTWAAPGRKDRDNSGGTIEAVPFICHLWPLTMHRHHHHIIHAVTQAISRLPFSPSLFRWSIVKWNAPTEEQKSILLHVFFSAASRIWRLCRTVCVIVLWVDIKSWAMPARRGCAFVLVRLWVSHCSAPSPFYLSNPGHPLSVSECPCPVREKRAPWCDVLFIQLTVLSFSLSRVFSLDMSRAGHMAVNPFISPTLIIFDLKNAFYRLKN